MYKQRAWGKYYHAEPCVKSREVRAETLMYADNAGL